ncbi:MAG: Uma2 family endonuclease [Saprospiraceae bacterium]|nr:Uma2 family endonuclease [Saprospiraceae bacterium]
MSVQASKRLITVSDYHKMGEAGILPERRIELINGEIIEMSPIGSRNAAMVDKISNLFTHLLFRKAIVRVQNPIGINHITEPEPDIAILKYRSDFYKNDHPQPEDVLLVIEISETTLTYDRDVKLPLYADAKIGEYWLVNLKKEQIEVHTEPVGNDYQSRKLVNKNGHLILPVTGEVVSAQDLF